ncbi:MAG: dihydrodipicolinate synthase family protein [Planctomycetota bacterium]|nr:dihydrodipicolinate synthase family protein [Planctomycetota bacterium]
MSRQSSISGVLAIVHTPFHDDDRIDFEAFHRQVDWAFQVGANGLGTGMVTETLRLSPEERRTLVADLVRTAGGRGVVFASVGAESTTQAVSYAKHAQEVGCDAVMAVPPVVSAISGQHLLAYYTGIAESIDLPVIVQDASGYVGQTIPLEVSLNLLDRFGPEKILFKPEASPIGPSLSELRDATGGRARVYEGSGGILLVDCFRRGIVGTMPGTDLLDAVVELWRALQAGDEQRIYRIYFPICAMVTLQMQAGLDGFLAVEKYLLVKRGLFRTARRRTPYRFELDPETAREVDRLFEILQESIRS